MGKRGKRKTRSSGSGSGSDGQLHKKSVIERGPSEERSVSDILSETNSVLYDNNSTIDTTIDSTVDSVFLSHSSKHQSERNSKMASNMDSQPTNSDIMSCLKGMESRLTGLEKRMDSFDELRKKVDKFDKDLNKLWLAVEERNAAVDQRMNLLEEKVESNDFSVNKLSEDVITLQRQRNEMQEDIVYMQSQSMRQNLIFSNIPEPANETTEDAERALRGFIHEKLRVAKEVADELVFERVHRMGPKNQAGGKRPIVARFHQYRDREMVRKQWPNLKGTEFYVSEQFPKQVVDRRKKLYPQLKAARDAGKRAWISYDTLYIDGKAVRG